MKIEIILFGFWIIVSIQLKDNVYHKIVFRNDREENHEISKLVLLCSGENEA